MAVPPGTLAGVRRPGSPAVEFFVYCRDKPGTARLREELSEAHWAYMDRFADAMIARGPTLTPDRETATGSLHIVDLPDAEAALAFALEEPYYRAGVFGEPLVRRWRNELGGTMWDHVSDATDPIRFLVLGHGRSGMSAAVDGLLEEHRRYFVQRRYLDHLIERGPLLSDDGLEWVGSAMLVEVPGRAAVEEMLADEPHVKAGLYENIEIHDWQFGGRPAAA
jgi:uncharacterized protein